MTSPCRTWLSVAALASRARFDYRVEWGGRVIVPVSWVGDGLVRSVHYLPAAVRRGDVLTVVGRDGTRLSVRAVSRSCGAAPPT